MSDEKMSLEEEYRKAVVKLARPVVKIARLMPALIDEVRRLRGAILLRNVLSDGVAQSRLGLDPRGGLVLGVPDHSLA